MFRRFFRRNSASIRQQLFARVALGLTAATLCASVAGVVVARLEAGATWRALLLALGLGAGVVVFLTSLLAARLDQSLAAPLVRFAETIRRAAAGDASVRAEESGPAELRQAARGFNSVLAGIVDERARLQAAGVRDPLTGLMGNQRFHESLGAEIKRAQREDRPLSLALIDLDTFAAINDAYGREFGDELLRRVANELRRLVRATDLLARVGGDTFALILPGVDAALAFSIAERARRAVTDAPLAGRTLASSAGVAAYPDDARDGSTLLQQAGGALRWAKSSGRNRTRRFDPARVTLQGDAEERAEIERLLELERPLIPYFQPLVSLSTGRILGYEALSRFPNPPGRSPEAWFSQASRCGAAALLEAAALRAALATEGRPAGAFLSLNLSPLTLGSPEVQAVLPDDMSSLVVELTEHELACDLEALESQLAELRDRGARIAVDDAGAGYSGLQQVMRIRPDVIKLDRSLIMNVNQDPAREALIDSFVRFARRTHASVCAEGIETMEELNVLADLDVAYGQGYVLARPSPDWGTLPSAVSDSLLRRSLRSQGDIAKKDELPENGDQRLEYVSARLSKIHELDDLEEVFELIAAELSADGICLSRWERGANAVETILDTSGEPAGTRFNLANYPSTAHVLNTGEALQVLCSDPGADLGEVALLGQLGFESLLMVPVVCRAERLGLFEAYSRVERPWTRGEINRARIISYQLGAVLDGLDTAPAPEPVKGSASGRGGDPLLRW